MAGELADLGSDVLGEALEGVETSADGGTTLSEVAQTGESGLDTQNTVLELSNVARELLAEGQGSGILQVGTANLDDLVESLLLLVHGVLEALQGREELLLDLENGSNVHGGREGVVGRGGHVDVVVGVDRLLGAHLTAQNLDGAVGDDLVGVHVGLGTGAGLPDDQREVVVELAGCDLGGGLLDGLTDLCVCAERKASVWSVVSESWSWHTQAELHVDGGSGALEDTKGANDLWRHAVMRLIDLEVGQRALGLSTPVSVGGDGDLAKGIALGSGLLRHLKGGGELAEGCKTGSLVAGAQSSSNEGATPLHSCRSGSEHAEVVGFRDWSRNTRKKHGGMA